MKIILTGKEIKDYVDVCEMLLPDELKGSANMEDLEPIKEMGEHDMSAAIIYYNKETDEYTVDTKKEYIDSYFDIFKKRKTAIKMLVNMGTALFKSIMEFWDEITEDMGALMIKFTPAPVTTKSDTEKDPFDAFYTNANGIDNHRYTTPERIVANRETFNDTLNGIGVKINENLVGASEEQKAVEIGYSDELHE